MKVDKKLLKAIAIGLVFLSLLTYVFLPYEAWVDSVARAVRCRSIDNIPVWQYYITRTLEHPSKFKPSQESGDMISSFSTDLVLCKPPRLNETVKVVVTLRKNFGRGHSNCTIDIWLTNLTVSYKWFSNILWKSGALWNGELPPYGSQTVSGEVMVKEPGLYSLFADGRCGGNWLFLNVTEGSTVVSYDDTFEHVLAKKVWSSSMEGNP